MQIESEKIFYVERACRNQYEVLLQNVKKFHHERVYVGISTFLQERQNLPCETDVLAHLTNSQNGRTFRREKCAQESEYFFEKDAILLARMECQLS